MIHHKSYGLVSTGFNKVGKRIVYILDDIIIFLQRRFYVIYTVYNFELTNHGKFPYPGFIQGFLHYLRPGPTYPGISHILEIFLILSSFNM